MCRWRGRRADRRRKGRSGRRAGRRFWVRVLVPVFERAFLSRLYSLVQTDLLFTLQLVGFKQRIGPASRQRFRTFALVRLCLFFASSFSPNCILFFTVTPPPSLIRQSLSLSATSRAVLSPPAARELLHATSSSTTLTLFDRILTPPQFPPVLLTLPLPVLPLPIKHLPP
jgi:hypothetical protein